MQWLHNYQLFLFDFDGLLVNTEEIHYLAYKNMCAARGVILDWDFTRYCQAAHYEADALHKQLYACFPQLQLQEPNWNVLYAEKKQAVHKLFVEGVVQLMPGAAALLQLLQKTNTLHCVVTHSANDLIQALRRQHPILDAIPVWITREHYTHPKPHPECYIKAIQQLAKPNEKVIGFEDTPRGVRALLGSRAQPVLICQASYPEIPDFIKAGVIHYPSLSDIPA